MARCTPVGKGRKGRPQILLESGDQADSPEREWSTADTRGCTMA